MFGLDNLPYGVFAPADGRFRVGVRVADDVLDVAAALGDSVFAASSLNPFMAQGPGRWAEVRTRLQDLLSDPGRSRPHLHRIAEVTLRLPFDVADYVDFYASEHHATNVGRLFRPGSAPLTENWKHLPIGYHGRAGTVLVSGTDVRRPSGLRKSPTDDAPTYGPSRRLDIEAEVGFVVGAGSPLGHPVPVTDLAEHVFGVCLVNDWSARDVQAWEYVPLGPFLGKSFATSVSAWVVPLAALESAWTTPPARDVPVADYLDQTGPGGLDLALEIALNGQVVSRPPFASMYWTPAQMLAHMTANGASTRTGDLFASGTVSGPSPDQYGSLLELSWAGETPLALSDGTTRTFLDDGDTVVIRATAPGPGGTTIGLGEVAGRVLSAVSA